MVKKKTTDNNQFGRNIDEDVSTVFANRNLDQESLQYIFNSNQSLIKIGKHVIELLYRSLKDTGFIVLLTDAKGCILCIQGDSKVLKESEKSHLKVGAHLDEQHGNSAVSLALHEARSVQITAEEHHHLFFRHWTCSASPIKFNSDIIGCINISGDKAKVHPHTLSLVEAAAQAIESKWASNEIALKLYDAQHFAYSMMNQLSFGVIAVNMNDDIQWINDTACRILNIKRSKLIHSSFEDILSDWYRVKRVLLHDLGFEDEELHFDLEDAGQPFHFNAYTIKAERKEILGYLVTFRSFRRTMNMLSKLTGMRARYTFNDLVYKSSAMKAVVDYARKISITDSSVLMLGESGTGKEVFAQAIHNASDRCNSPFVAVNCGAISSDLIESELFGYEEGAFTGAIKGGRPGKFELAISGTLFLDEIGEMPKSMQVKLLRALQEGKVTRVGGQKEIEVDVRIISATNRNLYEEVSKGQFREDLYYRLNVLTIEIPALRNRNNDVLLLARHFLIEKSHKADKPVPALREDIISSFQTYSWPGNVRELENFIEKYIVLDGNVRLEKNVSENDKNLIEASHAHVVLKSLQDVEKEAIVVTLSRCEGNISKAASILGIGRNTLYDKLKKHSIHLSFFK